MIAYQKRQEMQKYNYDVCGIGNAVTFFVELQVLFKK